LRSAPCGGHSALRRLCLSALEQDVARDVAHGCVVARGDVDVEALFGDVADLTGSEALDAFGTIAIEAPPLRWRPTDRVRAVRSLWLRRVKPPQLHLL